MRKSIYVVALLWAVSSPALACDLDSPTARLPGYSDEQAKERAHKLWSDWDVIRHYNRTKALLDEAPTIYLARVVKVVHEKQKFLTEATVEPLRTIKGDVPTGTRTLQGFIPDSCDNANGDGDGAYTRETDLIIVFEGVSKQPNRPNGIDSVRVSEVRNIKILDEVQAWLNAQPGYKPWD